MLDTLNQLIPILIGSLELHGQAFHSSLTPPQRGGAVNSTAVTQQPPQHTSPTSPIHHESLNIPQGIDTSENTVLREAIDDHPGLMNKILNSVAGNFFTPQRSDNKRFGNNLETNSVTSEPLNSSDSQSPISSNKTSKAYSARFG